MELLQKILDGFRAICESFAQSSGSSILIYQVQLKTSSSIRRQFLRPRPNG